MNTHTLNLLIQDRYGALNRVVSLLRRRGFGIVSLAIGASERAGISRMTIVVRADQVEQVTRQLARLIEVLSVTDVTQTAVVERETVLAKIDASPECRAAIVATAERFGARIVAVQMHMIVLELTSLPTKVERFIEALGLFGVRELSRTGRIAMACVLRHPQGEPLELGRSTLNTTTEQRAKNKEQKTFVSSCSNESH